MPDPSTTSSWKQRRGVDELDRRGELVVPRSGVVEQRRTGERQHRPHPLAAAGDQCPASSGISATFDCIRSRITALTAFMSVAVSAIMGSSDGARFSLN
jgi:hypothetical protein